MKHLLLHNLNIHRNFYQDPFNFKSDNIDFLRLKSIGTNFTKIGTKNNISY